MKVRDVIKKRVDVKRFDLKAPDWRKVVRAIEFARFGTSAGNQFATRFIVIDDERIIDKLTEASQQSFIGKAKSVVVVVSDPSSLVLSYKERGEKYCTLQAGAAIQNFLLGLEEEKLVTSWVWYFEDEQVKRILGIPDSVKVEGIFPIGIKTKVAGAKKRSAKLENILFFGKWGEKKKSAHISVGREAV